MSTKPSGANITTHARVDNPYPPSAVCVNNNCNKLGVKANNIDAIVVIANAAVIHAKTERNKVLLPTTVAYSILSMFVCLKF